MSYLVAGPDLMSAAAAELERIGAALAEATAAAAAPTTAVASAGADEVSKAVAAAFSSCGQAHQAISAQAAALHGQFVQTLTAAANAYTGAEATAAASLQSADSPFGMSAPVSNPAGAVALIMGPSGIPVPPSTYVHAVNDLYIRLLDAGASPWPLTTPEGLYPITGVNSLTFNASVAQGVLALNHAILHQIHSGNHVDVFG
ncbi:MAG: PE domain-containing protein, partial [Mycobacterium sp.]|nr:PE domain-containing protein [Mycobacterium sp.]